MILLHINVCLELKVLPFTMISTLQCDEIAPRIVELIAGGADPNFVCDKLGVCKGKNFETAEILEPYYMHDGMSVSS